MKNAKELAYYTAYVNQGDLRKWCIRENKYSEDLLNRFIKEYHIGNKKDTELVREHTAFNREGGITFANYMTALTNCWEEYTLDTAAEAIDIVFQEMAENLTERMHRLYPCLQRTHVIVMRANKMRECVMYIGPNYFFSQRAHLLFSDGGVFMTQGFSACGPLFNNIWDF